MTALKLVLANLRQVSCSDEVSNTLICNIIATISDRASTQISFNNMLDLYCSEIADNTNQLSPEGKTAVEPLLQFFCNLHLLVHLADSVDATLKDLQEGFVDGEWLQNPPTTATPWEPLQCNLPYSWNSSLAGRQIFRILGVTGEGVVWPTISILPL